MADDGIRGSDWTERQVDLIVADYFDMLRMELAGEPFVKARRNAALQTLTGRSRTSIEFKHCNISAVLVRLGLPTIGGYKRRDNFQGALIDGIGRFLAAREDPVALLGDVAPKRVAEARPLFLEPPPSSQPDQITTQLLERLIAKFDPAARDARNRALGREGEERVLHFERDMLAQRGRPDLARKVRWISEEDGDGAGYDIRSFTTAGSERLIEVKTTTGDRLTPFFISENERAFSVERPDAFRLVRLFDFARQPRAFELEPPLDTHVRLMPTGYRASF